MSKWAIIIVFRELFVPNMGKKWHIFVHVTRNVSSFCRFLTIFQVVRLSGRSVGNASSSIDSTDSRNTPVSASNP